jgi:glutathione S-transferase
MADPVIYGPAYSTYTRSILIALEEKGVPYRLEEINVLEGENQNPNYLSRQPFAKVPAFEHDGFELFETTAILLYVDEAFDGSDLQPKEPRERAKMTQVISIINAYAYTACISSCVTQRLIMPLLGEKPDEDVIAAAVQQATTSIEALEAIIDGKEFFVGDKLSLADLIVVPVCDYFSQTPEGEVILGKTPNLKRWWDTISKRESVVKTKPVLG